MQRASIDPATQIGAVHLVVPSLDRSLRFYLDTLGLRELERTDGVASLTADGSAPLVVLHERPQAAAAPRRSSGLYHFAILVPSRPDLARALQHLLEAHYSLQGAADHLVSEALYLADPDGNGIEIYRDRPRPTWTDGGGSLRMGTEALDVDSLLDELEKDPRPWQGLSLPTRIGHIHLQVAGIPQAEAFYQDVLGFQRMARYGPSASFLAAGGYHHHIGVNTWNSLDAPPPPDGAAGLLYYTIDLPNEPALEEVERRLRAADVAFTPQTDGVALRDPSQNGIRLQVAPVLGLRETGG